MNAVPFEVLKPSGTQPCPRRRSTNTKVSEVFKDSVLMQLLELALMAARDNDKVRLNYRGSGFSLACNELHGTVPLVPIKWCSSVRKRYTSVQLRCAESRM